jgi:regulator of replication initiation timing
MRNDMRIIQLTAENFKRLRAVQIKPDGNIVQITGRNAQGKTSCLDAISTVLGGAGQTCRAPIRKGQEKAKIICDLGDLTVTRTFTATGGGTLTVANKEGARFTSPQAVLDKLVGRLSFDPLAFSRMDSNHQLETLKTIVGLDFTKDDSRRADLYEERTAVNRELKAREAQLARVPEHTGTPDKEESIADLASEYARRQRVNTQNAAARREAETLTAQLDRLRREYTSIEVEIDSLRKRLTAKNDEIQTATRQADERTAAVAELKDEDVAEIQTRMSAAEELNQRVRQNADRAKLAASISDLSAKSDSLTEQIGSVDAGKTEKLAAAKFPVDGLSFDETGVTFGGLPFEQASSAEQLRISVAIGIALNPKLKVLLIRDGSLLDADSLKLVAEMAADSDAQVWVERVDDTRKVGVVIEDGSVVETEAADDDGGATDLYAAGKRAE